ncbi:MAG TPA: carboxypeptidase regulatory-like domain-containing protein [Thermoanaerobaculia bacterium]|nr:carboxypeptidase regulatory-like domain-containing protein [Thermoanaerobaculia bacterium]
MALVVLSLATAARAQQTFTLAMGESRTFQMMGASAAWAIDASIVEAAAGNGSVTLFGRNAGTTKVVIVSVTGQNAFDVIVKPRAGTIAKPQARASSGVAELRYSSAAKETQTSVATTHESKSRRVESNIRVVHTGEARGDRSTTSIASASYRVFTKNRELTLFDRDVDHSPLTLSNTPLRGVHYLDDHWRLHAGVTTFTIYQSFFLPVERQFVAGGGYAFRTTPRSTITPSVFAYRGEGTVASVLYDYSAGERMNLRAELGYSHGLGGALQLAYENARDHVRADVRYRPDDFAMTAGTPRGFYSDATWTREYRQDSSFSASVAATEFRDTRVLSATADVDHRLRENLSLLTGVSWGSFDGAHSLTVPAGARIDFARGGLTAIYRYAQSSANEGGHGFRLAGRASIGHLYASAYVDHQQNAPSLELIFSERPDLALALGELGIIATTPADVARALRDNAALVELGFIEGVTVDLAPVRTQAGLELALFGTSASRQRLRLRLLHNILESVASRTTTTIATLTWSRRLTASADVFASYSYWRTERRGFEADTQPFVEAGIRQRFDGFPTIGTGTIRGVVFADEDLDGKSDGSGVVAVIDVDGGTKSERTDADGTFAVSGLSRGAHKVSARIPDRPDAYFTTPSRVEANTGESVSFGIATSPARLHGRITSDAGEGVAGVRVGVARGTRQLTATTESDGRFAINVPPGEWQVSIVSESVPAGYGLTGVEPRNVMLERAQPSNVSFELKAHRSIAGSGAPPNATIEVPSLQKTIRADAQGRFSLRSLAPGEVTLIANGVEKRVVVPKQPGAIQVSFDAAVAAKSEPVLIQDADWIVQIGVYRVPDNAVRVVEQARASGVEATMKEGAKVTIVRAGPYATRAIAESAAAKLERAGLDVIVEKMPR